MVPIKGKTIDKKHLVILLLSKTDGIKDKKFACGAFFTRTCHFSMAQRSENTKRVTQNTETNVLGPFIVVLLDSEFGSSFNNIFVKIRLNILFVFISEISINIKLTYFPLPQIFNCNFSTVISIVKELVN